VAGEVTTLNYTDLGSPFGEGASGGSNTPTPTSMSTDIEQHHGQHMGLNHQEGGGSITPVPPSSKSAFIELQQHPYNPVRAYHPHHFQQPQGNPGHHDAGFGSPRAALSAYPFPPMHHNSYTGYHLGTYAPQCNSPPKDGEYLNTLKSPLSIDIFSQFY
jgi:homeobox protein DLX2